MKHKRFSLVGGALCAATCLLLSVFPAPAADAVVPASLTITNLRDEAMVYANNVSYFEGTTLRLTNCVMFAGASTNSARQGLSDVTIQLTIGNTTTSSTYTGTAEVETNGTWTCDAVVPTNSSQCYLQVKITDANTNSYIYPWKQLNHRTPL